MSSQPVPRAHGPIEQPRGIGVLLCSCGGVISRKVDLDMLRLAVAKDSGVRDVMLFDKACSDAAMDEVRLSLKAGDIDRLLIVGCPARSISKRYRDLASEAGLDAELVCFCDLLSICTQQLEKDAVIRQAQSMVRTALLRTGMLQSAPRMFEDPLRRVLIIGNGVSATVAAGCLLEQGFDAVIANPLNHLMANDHEALVKLEGSSFEQLSIRFPGRLEIVDGAVIESVAGHAGRFEASVRTSEGTISLRAGAIIVALDREPAAPAAGDLLNVVDQESFESMIPRIGPVRDIVMVAMDREGQAERSPMSTHEAVHHAMHVKGLRPGTNVTIIAKEVYAFGQCELGYRKAQEMGVRFIRAERMPAWDASHVLVHDVHSGLELSIPADLVVVDGRTEIKGMEQTCRVLGIPLARDGSAARGNPKVRPSSSLRQGIFVCGSASEMNLGAGPSMSASAAAARAATLLGNRMHFGGSVAEVDPERCSACLTCVRTCPYRSPSINADGKAQIDLALCRGCGMCAGACPSKAIQIYSYRDDQLCAEVSSVLREGER